MQRNFYEALHRYGRDESHLFRFQKERCGGKLNALPHFEALFNQYFCSSPQLDYLIPKKIHQIWLGSELPTEYLSYVKSWTMDRGWDYRLWTDADSEKILKYNGDLYHLTDNYGEKSDILRLEILYQEGGLYVDVDAACLKIDFFDQLHRTLTFYAGFEPLEHRWIGISNALFASSPGHPLLRKLIESLNFSFFENQNRWAVIKTGPKFVTKVIEEFIQNQNGEKLCFFPPSYFFLVSGNDIKKGECPLFQESASIHYWKGSWIR